MQIPSSARPPEPVVLSVTPAFRWTGADLPEGWTELERTREGGNYRSTVRRDPVFATPSPTIDPAPGSFEGAVDLPRLVRLAETDDQALAVPYAPEFAAEGDLPAHWYVSMPAVAEASSWPFVSLAVARHQPHSVEGQALSRVVRCEPVQLSPRRTLRVTRSGTQVTWDLSGLGQEFIQDFDLLEQPGAQASRVTGHPWSGCPRARAEPM